MRPTAVALIALLLVGCEEDSPPAAEDTGASTGDASDSDTDTDTDALVCADAPTLTYDTFGNGFLATYCNGCHGAGVPDRQGAPEMVVFDTREQADMFADRILARAIPAEGVTPMPPAGGITQDDLDRLEIWLNCFP